MRQNVKRVNDLGDWVLNKNQKPITVYTERPRFKFGGLFLIYNFWISKREYQSLNSDKTNWDLRKNYLCIPQPRWIRQIQWEGGMSESFVVRMR